MNKIGMVHHVLAYIAAVVAVVSMVLAGVSRLMGQNLGLQIESYMALATVALLFAIYFLVDGLVRAAKRAE